MREYTAIVADDEETLRIGFSILLETLWPGLTIVGQAENGIEALDMIKKKRPDIAFLDIRMPGMTGMAVAEKVTTLCRVVFITAYDRYAVRAFESETVDYILKPVTKERLQITIHRLKRYLDSGQSQTNGTIHKDIKSYENKQTSEYLQLVRIKTGKEIRFIPVSEVFYFKAENKYPLVQTTRHEYLIRTPIKELETRLDPNTFKRVHRCAIVQINRIKRIKRSFTNQMMIGFDTIEKTIAVSRSYEHLFKHPSHDIFYHCRK